MKKVFSKLSRTLPKQRRRRWKYVSPVRRRVGLALLVILLTCIYTGWHFSRDSRVRWHAKEVLEDLTGADVHITNANFSLFEGIRLYGVQIRLPDDHTPAPLFSAGQVVLKFRALDVFSKGRIEPTEIVCMEPVVAIEYDSKNNTSNAARLFALAVEHARNKPPTSGPPIPMPRIYLRNGILKSLVKTGSSKQRMFEETMNCTILPAGKDTMQVTVENEHVTGEKIQWARLMLDTKTGAIERMSGSASHRLLRLLPPKYHDWIRRYDPQGDFSVVEGEGTDPEKGKFEIALSDFSFTISADAEQLKFEHVTGKMFFRRSGVEFRDIRGKVRKLGYNAMISMHGNCGYAKDSPLDVSLELTNMHLPAKLPGKMGRISDRITSDYSPQGRVNVEFELSRDAGGVLEVKGKVRPVEVWIKSRFFPLRMLCDGGELDFTKTEVTAIDLYGRRDKAKLHLTGRVWKAKGEDNWSHDIYIEAKEVVLDKEFREALPKGPQAVFDKLSPKGRAGGKIHTWRLKNGTDFDMDVDVYLKGFASISYEEFPYRFENIAGHIQYKNGVVSVPWARSESGPAAFSMKGTFAGKDADFAFIARRFEFDEKFAKALSRMPRVEEEYRKLHLKGRAKRIEGRVVRKADKYNYILKADLDNAAYCLEAWPYAVKGVTGKVTLTPDKITLDALKGVAGPQNMSRIRLDGDVFTGRKHPCYDLLITGNFINLDDEFRRALPKNRLEKWNEFSPGGLADFRVNVKADGSDSQPWYNAMINARGMTMSWDKFPMTLRDINGRIDLQPGVVKFSKLSFLTGRNKDMMSAELTGSVANNENQMNILLSGTFRNAVITKELLAKIPEKAFPLIARFKPGGRFSARVDKFDYTRYYGKKDKADVVLWDIKAAAGFRDVVCDIGFGHEMFTGTLAGSGKSNTKGQFGCAGKLTLQEFKLKSYVATKLRCDIFKSPAAEHVELTDMLGSTMAGRVAGTASVILTKPMQYRMNLGLENIDLRELIKASSGRNAPEDIRGKLRGDVELSLVAGKKKLNRQATGELEIYKASMYKLPVILGLLNVIYVTVPGEGAFTAGNVKYHLKNDKIKFSEIFLTGPTLSVIGSGNLNLKTDMIKLTFLTGPPGKMPRMNELASDILGALSKELVELRVTGSLKEPKMETVTLRSLETIIKRLLEPAQQKY